MLNINQYNTHVTPTWCPGCGNWGIFQALKTALVNLQLNPWEVVVVTDIGCAGNMADFINTFTFHSLHGRSLPVGAGIKLANHHLKVICIIGDGACYGEGLNHFINLMRGNHDITVLVHDNFLYSLTTGQYSPTTPKGTITKSTPEGSLEEALNPLALSLANQATFCARGYALEINHLSGLLIQAIKHEGFALIDILQPCITLNKNQNPDWYKSKVIKLNSPFKSRVAALEEAQLKDKLSIGLFWQSIEPAYHQQLASLKDKTLIEKSIFSINLDTNIKEFI